MAKIAHRLSASSSKEKKGHPDGKLFPFSTCAQRHKNMEKGGLKKMLAIYRQETHNRLHSRRRCLRLVLRCFLRFSPNHFAGREHEPRRTEGGLSKLIIVEYFVARTEPREGICAVACVYLIQGISCGDLRPSWRQPFPAIFRPL